MKIIKCICAAAVLIQLIGCVGTRTADLEASPAYLSAHGWQHPQRLIKPESFTEYASAVQQEVRQFRIPFNPEQAEQEIQMASPTQILPADHCGDSMKGIAILVHGLSDTAFAMLDVGNVLAEACYISRTVLLPGHGTRAGDLLSTRLSHWNNTLTYLIDQAAEETNNVLVVGFSLGAVLLSNQAARPDSKIDGIVALSPAYYLSSYRLARWAPFARPFMRWIDKGIPDDSMRYEAMPTRGVGETVKAMRAMHKQVEKKRFIEVPWMLVQSLDDRVIVPEQNWQFWQTHATHPDSQAIQFYSDNIPEDLPGTLNLSAVDEMRGVLGLTHQAIHASPDNPHYGFNGAYRNCGSTTPRQPELVQECEEAESVSYGLWSRETVFKAPTALSTFNPVFEDFAKQLKLFAEKVSINAQ